MTRAAFAPALLALGCFAVLALGIAIYYPFPSPFDELQHYSVIRAQFERPDLAADPRDYGIVRPDALSAWSSERNYINHPALYYLLFAPLLGLGDGPQPLRLANVALATVALALVLVAGWRRIESARGRLTFAVIAASFPKAVLVAGMINNDNLAALATALVFAGLALPGGAAWLVALGLALAGWTKLTAFIALGGTVGCYLVLGGRRALWTGRTALILAGSVLGALAYAVMWWRTGALVPINTQAFAVPPEARVVLTPIGFAARFVGDLALKWPAAEASLPAALSGLLLIAQLALAAFGARAAPAARRSILAFLAGTALLFVIHLGFGWRAFATMGDLTTPQSRYYAVVWPGIALGGALALAAPRMPRWLTASGLALYLVMTVPGGLLLAAFAA